MSPPAAQTAPHHTGAAAVRAQRNPQFRALVEPNQLRRRTASPPKKRVQPPVGRAGRLRKLSTPARRRQTDRSPPGRPRCSRSSCRSPEGAALAPMQTSTTTALGKRPARVRRSTHPACRGLVPLRRDPAARAQAEDDILRGRKCIQNAPKPPTRKLGTLLPPMPRHFSSR